MNKKEKEIEKLSRFLVAEEWKRQFIGSNQGRIKKKMSNAKEVLFENNRKENKLARKPKFEEEAKKLEVVRKKLTDAIKETEDTQHSFGGNDEYRSALTYQEFAKKLREIKTVCGEEKSKEDKKENG